jgi:hypothetical protein
MRSIDRYALPPADLPTIRMCAACGYLRYFDERGCVESADHPKKPAAPLRPLPPVVAPEPLLDPPAALPERRPPGREIGDPRPLRRQAWKARA